MKEKGLEKINKLKEIYEKFNEWEKNSQNIPEALKISTQAKEAFLSYSREEFVAILKEITTAMDEVINAVVYPEGDDKPTSDDLRDAYLSLIRGSEIVGSSIVLSYLIPASSQMKNPMSYIFNTYMPDAHMSNIKPDDDNIN